ncbi:MAG: DUF4350 domain-containing protein [Fuerstiella sp.]
MKKKRRLQRSDAFWLTAVALLVLLQFWWLPGDPGTPDDTYSATIEGKRGFFQTLEGLSQGGQFPPVRRETLTLVPDQKCTLVVLSPDRYPDEHEQRELTQFVLNGGTLLFAPNWGDPTCSIPALSIQTTSTYFSDEDTVTSSSGTRPSSSPPTSVSPSAGADDTSAPGTTLPAELPAEAEDETDTTTRIPPNAAQTTPGDVPPSQVATVPAPTEPDPVKRRQDSVEDAMKRTPGGLPPQQSLTDLEDPDDFDQVSDFQTSSQLVSGPVPWRTRARMDLYGLNPVVLVESTSGTKQAAAWKYGNGLVLLCASADVFSNRAMLDPAQAELAVRLVEYAHAHHATSYSTQPPVVVLSEFLNATDSYRGTAVLMSPALRSGTLQLITIALLAGWFGFHRFGPIRRSTTSQRRSLTESAAAVGNLHFRTNSGSEAVHGYLEYMKTQLQKLFGRSVHLTDTAAIAARSGLDPDDVHNRISNATGLAGARFTSTAQAAAAIRDLSEILSRLQGRFQR